jgi:hypothetical protein
MNDQEKMVVLKNNVGLLLQSLFNRKKKRLGMLFKQQGLEDLSICYKGLRSAVYRNNQQLFEESVNVRFLRFLNQVHEESEHFNDELSSLQSVMKSLHEIGTIAASGRLGKDGYDIAVQINSIISWMRIAEDALLMVRNRKKPITSC